MQRKLTSITILLLIFCTQLTIQGCIHDHFAANATFHYFNDLTEQSIKQSSSKTKIKQGRLLQASNATSEQSLTSDSNLGNIRIYADYSFIQTGALTQVNQIKRVMNISSNYFYNIMKVSRLQRLFYPADSPLKCNIITVPAAYVTTGVIGDLGVLVSNQVNTMQYIAKSTACALLKSNNRPIWGVMIWNNNFLQYDQVGFQKIVYVAIHQLTHILGFSASMYSKYPAGNLYKNDSNGQYLTSPLIVQELNNHFGCNNSPGIILQDQDGTLIPSHNQRKIFGNQFMIASGKKSSYFSRATVALLASMGWYNVSFDYAQPTTWGRQRGCTFFQIDNCVSQQFCSGSDFSCDWDATAIGRCNVDNFAGSCKFTNYFTNTICIDENYQLKNLNANLNALERGGFNSRCFSSNFRQTGLQASALNNRCYITVCSFSGNFLFILVGQVVFVCTTSNMGTDIPAPTGLDGTLRCPSNFANYCINKKTCLFGCNKNGACINGQCLCTGSINLSITCLDVTLNTTQVQNTAGLLNSIIFSRDDMLILTNSKVTKSNKFDEQIEKIISKAIQNNEKIPTREVLSINTKAPLGTYFDPQFGQIVLCNKKFGCQQCNRAGCLNCPQGMRKFQGKCLAATRL